MIPAATPLTQTKARQSRQRRRAQLQKQLRIETLEDRRLLSVDVAPLLDINATLRSSNPSDIVEMGGTVYFAATTDELGTELWKSDGTDAGTVLVKDIRVGSSSSGLTGLVNVNGTLYFRANDGSSGFELWKSNGTAAGTVLVKDVWAGGDSFPQYITNVNGSVFFRANDGANGQELWKSDGTAAGTVLVKNLSSGGSSSSPIRLTDVSGTLFFVATDSIKGFELWKSDGTDAGTVIVKDIVTGVNGSTPINLTNVAGTLFFGATNTASGTELWKSDGTDAGTVLVKDLNPGSAGSSLGRFTSNGATLFFTAFTSASYQVWKSDGTSAGTVIVKSILPTGGSGIGQLTNVNGTIFFDANDNVNGYELWKSDGTANGTVLVKDISPGAFSSNSRSLTNVNGTLYFRAKTEASGYELWKSDGTASGTVLVKELRAGVAGSSPNAMINVNGSLFFRANDGVAGYELWKSNGTDSGTVMVKDILWKGLTSSPQYLTELNGDVFFSADNGVNGVELWKTNGTSSGTVLLKDTGPGSVSSSPRYLVNVGGTLYFSATTSANGIELWKSDGTANGTVLVSDIVVGTGSSSPQRLTNVNGTLFFIANTSALGQELWKSDGTAAGTVLVKDIRPGVNGSSLYPLATIGSTLFFRANDGINGYELWKSDGTTAGTVMVKDIQVGGSTSSSFPVGAVNFNGNLYFNANNGSQGNELWKSDGTSAGTVIVKDIQSGSLGSGAGLLTVLNGMMYFSADNGTLGQELWKSDGTANGTVLVRDLNIGSTSSVIQQLTAVGNSLYFSASTADSGSELWRSDGTSAGTTLVKDISPGSTSSFPSLLTNASGTLYFRANDGTNGVELWKSDGTTAGTVLVANFANDAQSSLPSRLTSAGSKLFFTAATETYGNEIYVVESAPSIPTSILLSSNTVAESGPSGTIVGTLSTIGSQPASTTFELLDAASVPFVIEGNTLKTNAVLDYEFTNYYSLLVRATSGGVSITRELSIFVSAVNEFDPTLTSSTTFSVFENTLTVSSLSASDLDSPIPQFTYTKVGGVDAARFNLSGNQLSFVTAPNFESPLDSNADNQYVVQVAVSDGSRSQTSTLTVVVTDINEAPINLELSALTFPESLPAGSVVGTLSAADQDGPAPLSFALATQAPNDNADFEIVGNQLRTRREFDYETLADRELLVRVVARDALNATSSPAVFSITVSDQIERPVANNILLTTNQNTSGQITLSGSAASPTFSITQQPLRGTLSGTAPNLVYTPNVNFVGSDQFFYTITSGGVTSFEAQVDVTVVGVLPTVTFQFDETTWTESPTLNTLPLRVNLSSPAVSDLVVELTVDNGTATPGQDFSAPTQILVRAGESSASSLINLVDDAIDEDQEFFRLYLAPSLSFINGSSRGYLVVIVDNDAPPTIALDRTSLTVDEANTTATVRVQLSAATTQAIQLPYTLSTQGALLGSDFTITGGSVNGGNSYLAIPAGATSAFLTVQVIDDATIESLESLKIQFSQPTYGTLQNPAASDYSLTIRDNDDRIVTLQYSLISVGENSGTGYLVATASPPFTESTTVPIALSGTASASVVGRDYLIDSPSAFVFGANQSSATLPISIVDDMLVEPREEIRIRLIANSSTYKLGATSQTIIGIVDNDNATLSFDNSTMEHWEGVGTIPIRVSLTKALSESMTIPLVLSSGTGFATKGTDYVFDATSITIPAGQTSATVSLQIVDDLNNEPTESVRISLGSLPANAQFAFGNNRSSTTVIKDNDPLLSITASSSTPENGTAEFKISLSAPTNFTTQALLTISGSSTFNVDYTRPVSGNFSMYNNASIASNSKVLVTIPDGVDTLYFRLPIVDDAIFEASETITVGIQSLTSAITLSAARTATTSIVDNDAHAVSISTANSNISEATVRSGFLGFKNRTSSVLVEMAQAATRDINVSIAFGGTAKFNVDYKVLGLDAKTGLTIKKGSKSASFTLEIISDTVFEGNETIEASIVAVSSPGTLMKPISKRTYTILDNDQPPGSGGGGFGLWGGADDAEAIAKMRAAIAQSNEPLTIAGTVTLTIDTQPKIGPIFSASQTTTARDLNGKAIPQTILAGPNTVGTVIVATGSKGPVDGAVAFFDLNRNGVLDFVDSNGNGTQDEDEISEQPFTTAADGSFAFSPDDLDINGDGVVEAQEGRLVLASGTDISTGLIGLIPLTAPVGLYNITPLSTIAESLVRTMNFTVLDAMNRTTQAFGIENYSLAEGVSLYQVLGNDALASRAYSAHVQIYSVAVGLAQFLAGVSGRDVGLLGSAVFDEMATYITADGSTFELASTDAIVALAQSVIEKQGIASVSALNLTAAASAIANGILEIQKVQLTSSAAGSGEAFLLSIYKAKKVVQGLLPADLKQLGAGVANRNAAYIDSTYTPSGIASLVAVQTANVTVPPVVGVDSLAIVEGDSGQKNLVFTATLVGNHNYPVSVQYATVDASATATTVEAVGDYQSQSGTLNWPAGNNTPLYVSIPIEGDAIFEADEYFRLLLSNPTGLVIREAEGRGFILNQDLLQSTTAALVGQTSSETLLTLSGGQTRLNQNGVETFTGLHINPTQGTIQGQANLPDQWIVDFSQNNLRADTWTFDGKAGATDEMLIQAGGFTKIDYSILSGNGSQTRLSNNSLDGELILNSVDIESSKIVVSTADRLIVRVPSTVGQVIVEDADTNETGRLRIRSANGSFAPIEFTNPGVLEIRRVSAATVVTVNSLDANFSVANLQIVTEVIDVTKPVSAVQSIAAQATSLTIPLTIVGSDPAGPEGSATGILQYELYVAVDNGPYSLVSVLPAATTTYNFVATSNHNYYFRSVARDNAGNLEVNTGSADAFTWVRDFDKPETTVTAANYDASGRFTITVSGLDVGGSQLTRFDVWAVVDTSAPTLVGSITAGSPGSGGVHTGSLNYQGLTDGQTHAYRFYSRGLDSVSNLEDAPINGDVVQSASFAIPVSLQATGIDVQLGAKQRSFVQYVDVMFNSATNLSELLTVGRVQVEKFGLTASTAVPGTGQTVNATVAQPGSGNRLRLNFGAEGLGGSRNALTGDGFYRVRVDSNRDGDFDDAGEAFEFHRLLGDANGDGLVDALDTAVVDSLYGQLGSNLDGDLNGDGAVNLTDKSFTLRTYRNRSLALQLLALLDD